MFKKNRYVYTCPDVINYRKNQYRLFIWSNVLSVGYMVAFFGALASLGKKTDPILEFTETPVENKE